MPESTSLNQVAYLFVGRCCVCVLGKVTVDLPIVFLENLEFKLFEIEKQLYINIVMLALYKHCSADFLPR